MPPAEYDKVQKLSVVSRALFYKDLAAAFASSSGNVTAVYADLDAGKYGPVN